MVTPRISLSLCKPTCPLNPGPVVFVWAKTEALTKSPSITAITFFINFTPYWGSLNFRNIIYSEKPLDLVDILGTNYYQADSGVVARRHFLTFH